MRGIMRGLLCLFLLLVGAVVSAAPSATEPDPSLAPAVAMAHRAERLKHAFRSGEDGAIQAAMQECNLLVRTYNVTDLTPLFEAMVLWAREQGAEGAPERGLRVLRELEPWAPGNPSLLGARIELMRMQGLKGYLWSLPDVTELVRARLSHPVHRWLWIAQHAAWLRMMATLMLWGWTLAMVLRYRNALRYLWEDRLKARIPGPTAMAVLGAFLLALPVLLGMDPSVSALLLLWLAAPFFRLPEARITFLVILLQLVHPALSFLEPMGNEIPPTSVVALQEQPQAKPLREAGARVLPAGDQAFLEGWQQLQAQAWGQAEATFERLLATHPNRAEVLNNLGVARFQQGAVDRAEQAFQQAFVLAPRSVEVLLNQSVLAFKRLDSVQGLQKQDEARKADPLRFSRLTEGNQVRNEPRTFAMPLPDSPERAELLGAGLQKPAGRVFRGAQLLVGFGLPLLAALLLMLRLRRSIRSAHPTQCLRCGEPFHTTDSPDVEICSKCHHLFVLKDGLHGENRKRKVDEVGAFQKAQRGLHRVLVVLLPGLDLCFMGHAREGITEFAFLCFAAGMVLATGASVRYPGEILADPVSTWRPLGLTLMAVLLLRSWLKLIPRRASR